jgi:peptide/nickel transport system permease protein
MKRYVGKRLLLGLLVLFGVVFIVFTMTKLLPVDAAQKWAGEKATPAQVEAAREELGLNDSFLLQFGRYIRDIAQGDLGLSYTSHRSVTAELKEAIPVTFELVLICMVVGLFAGVFLGLYSARYKNKPLDHFMRFFSVSMVSVPSFWIALALQLIFYGIFDIFPLAGRLSAEISVIYGLPHYTGMLILDSIIEGNPIILKDALWHIVLPLVPLCMVSTAYVARMVRSSLIEIFGEDYIIAERSYGITDTYIMWIYALKNARGFIATLIAMDFAYMLVNTYLVETIFSFPGIGKYIADSIMTMDYPAIMGAVIFSAFACIICNLIADLIIALDPRVRI